MDRARKSKRQDGIWDGHPDTEAKVCLLLYFALEACSIDLRRHVDRAVCVGVAILLALQ